MLPKPLRSDELASQFREAIPPTMRTQNSPRVGTLDAKGKAYGPQCVKKLKQPGAGLGWSLAATLALLVVFCSHAQTLQAQSVTLAWDPSSDTHTAGYIVYYGTDGIHFNNQMDVGTNTSATLSGLQAGTTNYFEVVAYDTNHDESPPSNLTEYTSRKRRRRQPFWPIPPMAGA